MKQTYIIAGVFVVVTFLLTAGTYGESNIASTEDKSSGQPAKLHIDFEEGLITADIKGASLKDVVEALEEATEAKFVLMGEQSLANEAIFALVEKKPLAKSLAKIFSNCSYAVTPLAGSDMPKVTIFMEHNDAVGEADDAMLLSDAETVSSTPQVAFVPSDLDEYMPLSDEMPGESEMEQYSELDLDESRATGLLSPEEQAAWEERQRDARIERALSALDSKHTHLRSMAVDELTGISDERATNALSKLATSKGASDGEKRMGAQALWHHAGDLGFSDSTANQALRQLATDGDPSVQEIAMQALDDMERYQRRSAK